MLVSEGNPYRVVAGPAELFWLGYGAANEVNETPLDGGPTRTLATPPTYALDNLALASDGTLYWTTAVQVQALVP